MIILGITGSIGMGKSTASQMLESLGVPVHDSDAGIHDLLKPKSEAWKDLKDAFPAYLYPQIYHWSLKGRTGINRKTLGKLVFDDPPLRKKLESILHPWVRTYQDRFIAKHRRNGTPIIGLDIPLLFETGADSRVDYVMNVSAPAFIQERRVLARKNMTREKFENIRKSQMNDGEKNARADFTVHSGLGRAHMMREIKNILLIIRKDNQKAA